MTWLVTGGAGYIGSHVLDAFARAGVDTVALDSLDSGHREFVPDGVPFIHASILDTDVVRRALADHKVTGVVHLAGYKYAGESVKHPLLTYETERHRHGPAAEGHGGGRRRKYRVFVVGRRLWHAAGPFCHRAHADRSRIAVRGEQTDRGVADPGPRRGPRPEGHGAKVLQRCGLRTAGSL